MVHRAVPPILLAALALPACGSDDAPSDAAPPRGGPALLQLTATQRACVQKQGVALPQPGRPRAQPLRGGPGGGQLETLRAAMEKCGVDVPAPPAGGPPPGGRT